MRLTSWAQILIALSLLIGGVAGLYKPSKSTKWHKKASKKPERTGVSCYKCLSEEECQQGGELIQCEATFGCETRFPSPLREYVLYRGCPTTPPKNSTCFDDPMTGEHVCHCDYDACNAKGINLRVFPAKVRVFKPKTVTRAVLPTAGQAPVFCYTCAGVDSCKRGGIKTLCDDHNGCAIVYPDSKMEYVTAKTCSNNAEIQGCKNERTPAGNYVCFCNTRGCNKGVFTNAQDKKQQDQHRSAGIGFLKHKTENQRTWLERDQQDESTESSVGSWEWVPGKWIKNPDSGEPTSSTKRMRRRRKKFRTTTPPAQTTPLHVQDFSTEATNETIQLDDVSKEASQVENMMPVRKAPPNDGTLINPSVVDGDSLPPSKMNSRATGTEKQIESAAPVSKDGNGTMSESLTTAAPSPMTTNGVVANDAHAVTSLKGDLQSVGNGTVASTTSPVANVTAYGAVTAAQPPPPAGITPTLDTATNPLTADTAAQPVDSVTTRRTPYPTKAVTPASNKGKPKKPPQGTQMRL